MTGNTYINHRINMETDQNNVVVIDLFHWYVSAAVYWYFTRQSFGYINYFVTVDSA